jgi:hypothetical protein
VGPKQTESSLQNVILKNKQDGFLDKDRMMDNVQKRNICSFVIRFSRLLGMVLLTVE